MQRILSVRGRKFVVDEEDTCIHQLFWDEVEAGHWEPYTFAALEGCLKPGSVFLDLGAWLGAVSLYAAALGTECYAIEPDLVAFHMLLRNVLANPKGSISAYQMAIADHTGELQLGAVDGLGSSMTSVRSEIAAFNVPCCTLSEFAREFDRVDVVKIDVEGAESLVLADLGFFERFRPTFLITLHPHLAPCSLDDVGKLYRSIEQLDKDVYLLAN